jgi:hypothetical protein
MPRVARCAWSVCTECGSWQIPPKHLNATQRGAWVTTPVRTRGAVSQQVSLSQRDTRQMKDALILLLSFPWSHSSPWVWLVLSPEFCRITKLWMHGSTMHELLQNNIHFVREKSEVHRKLHTHTHTFGFVQNPNLQKIWCSLNIN